jgi:hypothetical protein
MILFMRLTVLRDEFEAEHNPGNQHQCKTMAKPEKIAPATK